MEDEDFKYVLVPVSLDSHWVGFIIDWKTGKLFYADAAFSKEHLTLATWVFYLHFFIVI